MEPIPVICDQCRAAGLAGEDPFADLADLLSFTPVPRRPHANGWTPEFQRAFIAALATTGSAPRAARAIGKHAFGAEQLRRAKGGSSFAAAWDAALELARERDLAGMREGLADLAAEQEEERQQRRAAILPREQRQLLALDPDPDPVTRGRRLTPREEEDAELELKRQDYLGGIARVRQRITHARRLYLAGIAHDLACRAAWELLVGPVDWVSAECMGPQADEPFCDDPHPDSYAHEHNMRRPDMLMTAEAGLIAEFTGGPDALAEFRRLVAENESAEPKGDDGGADASPWSRDACPDRPACGEADTFDVTAARDGSPSPSGADLLPEEGSSQFCRGQDEKETEAITAYRESLKAEGWTEDDQGNLWSPEHDE